ncbi:hypothetical protein SDC9_27493 [bioreactor metagenome]|uniref:Uncharacterized protein n=1 Tax=bioreactor metagenome TaxID=1076179 RepID=A0A644US78_9ZZZZ|nr:YlbF family regulator [Negativicutes bacterium]
MNIYDKAHDLAKALNNSDEYRAFLAAKQAVDADEQAKTMVHNFILKQMEIEYEMMSGKPEDKDKIEQLQKMYDLIAYNAKAHDFLQAHMRFQRIIADVYKIIGDSVAEGLDLFAKA